MNGAQAVASLPWVEKYRPRKIDEIVGNKDAVERLAAIASTGNMPNLIFTGPPGIGKTTSVLCLAHALLGPSYKDAVLELNASDDRGIDVVRNKIKMFAQKKVTLPPGRHKIILLDEAGVHDKRRAASVAKDHGALFVYHSLRACVQRLREDYRTYPIALCDCSIHSSQ